MDKNDRLPTINPEQLDAITGGSGFPPLDVALHDGTMLSAKPGWQEALAELANGPRDAAAIAAAREQFFSYFK